MDLSAPQGTGQKGEVQVRLYADEIKPINNRQGQRWMYIGLLAIQETHWRQALDMIISDRDNVGYFSELKSTKLSQRPKIELAKSWLRRVMHDDLKCFHFYILGLHLDYLQHGAFGDGGSDQICRIYNRFFRTAVAYTLKYYFSEADNIEVVSIFHDKTEMEGDEFFDWHTIWRLENQEEKITFHTNRIAFIDSDHEKEQTFPEQSHFIQLIDLILGVVRQCLDFTSNKSGIIEAAKEFSPLISRLVDQKRHRNPNSRYKYHRRCRISFFPSKQLTLNQLIDPWERCRSSFYVARPLLLTERGQGKLF